MKIIIHQKPGKIKLTISRLTEMMERACADLNLADGQLSFIFANKESISALHDKYFGYSTPTDVITFNLSEDSFEGEVYIGWETAGEQANYYNVSLEDESLRLMIHGILHLNGMHDDTEEQQARMKNEEDRLLKIIKTQSAH